jgi:hypothetical protein
MYGWFYLLRFNWNFNCCDDSMMMFPWSAATLGRRFSASVVFTLQCIISAYILVKHGLKSNCVVQEASLKLRTDPVPEM